MESNALNTGWFLSLLTLQVTVVLAAGLAASYLLRSHPARAHRALTLALVAVVVLPAATWSVRCLDIGFLEGTPASSTGSFAQLPTFSESPIETGAMADTESPVTRDAASGTSAPTRSSAHTTVWQSAIPWLWGAASAFAGLYFLLSFFGGLRILRSARLVTDAPYTDGARHASDKLRLAVTPTIFASTAVRCPSVWCWRVHPALLVPAEDQADRDTDWATLFTHELAHYVRRDHLADLLSALVLVALPWHPLAWWARNRLALLSEDACDDWALTTNGTDAAGYAESLLQVAVQPRPAFVQAMASNRSHLVRRIRRITTADVFRPRVGRTWSACAALLLVCVVVAAALAQPGTTAGNATNESSERTASNASMERALELAKALSDQRGDEEAVAAIRSELNELAGGFQVGENLLMNSGFENGDGLVPESWAVRNESLIQFEWNDGAGFAATRGVHITKTEGKFPYATLVQTIDSPGEDCLVQLIAHVKANEVGKAVLDLVFLDEKGEWVYHIWAQAIGEPWENGTHDWKQHVAYAYVPSGTKKIEVSAQMYWPGELWLDNIELREVKP
ncbi:MAG: M56 family metallopeptidase [Candidatus Hydrogenedentes bacterium]|nr:M56 family metallopeptidase [Candidatus Hydrogenedentota bacterium]